LWGWRVLVGLSVVGVLFLFLCFVRGFGFFLCDG
jgi:hypothetical protein